LAIFKEKTDDLSKFVGHTFGHLQREDRRFEQIWVAQFCHLPREERSLTQDLSKLEWHLLSFIVNRLEPYRQST
jgi:hypothetical protein